jgi:hypothetical protein
MDANLGIPAVDGELTFEDLCLALRRNDPSVTEVVGGRHRQGFINPVKLTNANARRLGVALQGNSHVTSIVLDLFPFEEDAADSDSAALLLQFIRDSPSLQDVKLGRFYLGHTMSDPILRPFFFAIAENSVIQKLELRSVAIDLIGFVTLMKRAQSLNELIIFHCDFGNVAARELAAKALGAHLTLESLNIQTLHDDRDMVKPFLLHLGTHPCLRELTLWCAGDPPSLGHVDAVAYFLRTSRTLVTLFLYEYKFNKDIFEPILKGIHLSESLTCLRIESCSFDLESTMLFQDILKPKNDDSTIRELLLGEVTFDQRPLGSVVATILSPKQVDDVNGSKKGEILSLDMLVIRGKPDDDLQSFFEILGDKATSMRLQCVRLNGGRLDLSGCDALAACLPKLIYLSKLAILNVAAPALNGSSVHKKRLLGALKQNWSLLDVQMTTSQSEIDERRLFTGNDLWHLHLYIKRNRTIPALVADSTMDRYLFPKLFEAAKQAPRTAPNSILIGLLALGDTVGSQIRGNLLRSNSVMSVSAERELTFEDICSALRRNDPSVTEVVGSRDGEGSIRPMVLTNANACRLGEDLKGNTLVRLIALDLIYFEEDATDSDDAALLLQFMRESPSLEEVNLGCFGNWDRTMSDTARVRRFFSRLRKAQRSKNCNCRVS